MSRRALPKLKPDVEYSHLLADLKQMSPPWDPDLVFGHVSDLEIEVGCGKGLHLVRASGDRPERDFLGIEIAQKYAKFAAYRLAQHDRTNARIICGDALLCLRDFLPDRCAVAVHVYFPDPWWKARHHKRRVMKPETIQDIQRVLRPSGQLHFWTDVEEYFHSTCQLVADHSQLRGPVAIAEPPSQHDMDYRTHFERRMRKKNLPVFRCLFEKK